jgi:zinc protease
MRKIVYTVAAACLMLQPAILNAQAKLVEVVKKTGNETVIPYQKYVLPNGLTLLIHEDHSDPIVHVDVTYHVGSAREEIGKSGFAHFFEHMMFQGSDNVGDEQHFKIITEAGGTLNGTTNRDRTNYFETVPANQLEKMLWLEADRMGFLLDAVTQEKFEVQRATVKNERGQRYDNQPYGLLSEVAAKNLYPYGHPYSWLTIGYIEDLNRVNVDDLKNFFLRWYGPNNAVLTVGGDVNPKQVVAWVEKYFGSIPPGPKVEPVKLPAPKLEADRYVSMMDNYAKLPMLRVVYPSTPSYSKDEPALDCLAEILGQGKNSILYKNFVKSNKAVNASVYNSTSELAGEFTINITPYPGQKLADLDQMLQESLKEFEQRGVTDDDILKYRSKIESRLIYGLESVSGKVSQLAAFYTFTGDANYIGKQLAANTSVTKEDVMRVYNQFIKGKPSLKVSVLTKNSEDNRAGADNYTISENGYTAPSYGYEGLAYNKAKDNFDRSKQPGSGSAVVVKAPEFWKRRLPGNIRVIGTETNEIPAVNLLLTFKGGAMTDAANKAGTANLFAAMMTEDTKNYTSEAFALALEQLGSSINISASDDQVRVQVRSLTKNLDKTLALLEERLLRSVFNADDFERNKKRTTEGVKNALNQPAYVASAVYSKLLHGADNPLSRPSTGTEATLANIQLSDVEHYYKNLFSKADAEIVVVGDISEKNIISKLDFLQQMPGNKVELPQLPSAPKVEKTVVYFIDVPGAAQTEFRVGHVTPMRYDATGPYYRSSVMNYPLGGAFNSRLNLYLREEKGWTYGARSNFRSDKHSGEYSFSAGIKAAATDSALSDVLRIIEDYKANGVRAEELEFTKKSMTQSEARKFETGFQKAGFLNNILTYDLPKNYTELQNKVLEQMTLNDINELAKQQIPSGDKLLILLVGDKASLADRLKSKGFELVELDKEGNKLVN